MSKINIKEKKLVFYTLYARNGIYTALKSMERGSGIILVPSYSCGDEIESIRRAGFKILPYSVNKDLSINVNDIKEKINKKVIGILVTHYFGFYQKNIVAVRCLCDKIGLFLIEDKAHCLVNPLNNEDELILGDICIYSLRKFFDLPHGGMLVIKNKKLISKNIRFKKPTNDVTRIDILIHKKIKNGEILPGTTIERIYENVGLKIDQFGPRLEQYGGYNLGMPLSTTKRLKNIEFNKIKNERLKIYRLIDRSLNRKRLIKTNLFSQNHLKNGSPLFYPIITKQPSNIYIKRFRKNGINFVRPFWNHTHRNIYLKNFPSVKYIKKHLLIIPINKKLITHSSLNIINRVLS